MSFRTHGHAGATLQQHTAERVGTCCWAPCSSRGAPASSIHEATSTQGCSLRPLPNRRSKPTGCLQALPHAALLPQQPQRRGTEPSTQGLGSRAQTPCLPLGCPLPALPMPPQPTGLHRVPTTVPSCPVPTCPCQTPRPSPAAARSGGLGANSEGKPMCIAPFSEPAAAPC